ncbi:hypothetical protein PYW07_000053 [Mythimna separata]|uniref:Laminin G domain-containing protein n=1 Tax=Mythimna separata TaxID=271217 RepID=A0AAD8E051_MYTSE|nr:hypothetical protein PYW07_000052 [Mythimna separata]KAJ8736782.1 hypothetical protein PYW07_000053 [Mythimna separata]
MLCEPGCLHISAVRAIDTSVENLGTPVVKSLYVVSVGVDGHFSKPGLGRGSSTQTQSALYIGGGLTRYLSRVHGKRSQRGFTGCIKNIVIGESPIKIPITAAYRNTHVGVCPVD